ncbi:glycosyl hydrolase family 28-related protein [Bosea sp. 685]|uniref:glycosyl hydrolase family 28-related protein n=1 Tax=Bosea sp. 685 TaxID=3080057 RepID=UPI0028936F79|nr:glycosyl hydrolase family 28-related protein [Bosea sp. 685]WNJ88456.1 glycosyl hydrolase family 28-related protein [Bosea sp. 685]
MPDVSIVARGPSSLRMRFRPGLVGPPLAEDDYATQGEAEAGIDTEKVMSPLRTKQSILVNAKSGTWLQNGTGAVARTMDAKLKEFSISVKDFGAVGDGAADDTAAIQRAIDFAQTFSAGGIVYFPRSEPYYRCAGTLNITGHGVTLEFETALTKLVFVNGALDCISVDGTSIGSAGVYNITIRRGLIDHSGKTGGTTIKLYKANNVLLDRVQVNNAYQPYDFNFVNNVMTYFCQANIVESGQFALRFRAPGDGSGRSDVLTIINSVLQCGTTGADGIEWDGAAHTLRIFGSSIIGARDAFVIKNTAASAANFPSFLYAFDLEVDGTTRKVISASSGRQINFTNCDLFCLSSASGPVIDVSPDTGASYTSSWRFDGGRISGGQGVLLSYNAKNLTVVGVTLAGGANAGSGSAPAIAIGAVASDILISGNNIGSYWGTTVNHSYAVTVASGAVRVFADGNNCFGCVTGEMQNNASGSSILLGGGINRLGVATKSFLGTDVIRTTIAGAVQYQIINDATGVSAQAKWTLSTGTANSFRSGSVIDNSGAPYYVVNGGGAITIEYNDVDANIWRSNAAVEKGRLDTLGFKLPTGRAYFVNNIQVVGARDTGWTAMTGTGSKAVLAAAAAGTASAAYTQSDLQSALNRIAALEARLRSLDAALFTHGLIGV